MLLYSKSKNIHILTKRCILTKISQKTTLTLNCKTPKDSKKFRSPLFLYFKQFKKMETLIGILLYIGALTTNVEYTTAEINQLEAENQTTISVVENDNAQLNAALSELNDVTIQFQLDKVVVAEEIDW